MLKLMGMVLVIGCSAIIGLYIPKLEKDKINFLSEFKKSFYLLKNEINYALNTLSISFLNIYERTNNQNVSLFFYDLHNELENRNGQSIKEIWERNVDKLIETSFINKNEASFINSFGSSLGYLDKELQLKNIELLLDNLEEVILKHKEQYDRVSKLYSRLGILVGVTIAIVMF